MMSGKAKRVTARCTMIASASCTYFHFKSFKTGDDSDESPVFLLLSPSPTDYIETCLPTPMPRTLENNRITRWYVVAGRTRLILIVAKLQAFEWYTEGNGAHWKKLASKTDELADIGVTAMWLPPPTKASAPESVGYDIYDLYDLGEFDQKGGCPTKYGTKEELLALTKIAKEKGIVSYIDAVLNHRYVACVTTYPIGHSIGFS